MATTINGIPVYRATLASGKCGMKKISLVDAPAVQSDFLAFAAGEQPMRYAVQDEEKRLVYGVIMRADYPIYRYSKKTGEYYIMYSPETIRQMAERYLVEGHQNDVNLQHEEGSDVDGVNLVQWFIKDAGKGIAPAGFEDIEDGSLFGEFHVVNDEVWAGIKDGTYRGFSLEGIFGAEAVSDVVSTEKMEINSKRKITMKIMDAVRGAIAAALESVENTDEFKAAVDVEEANEQSFGSVATDKGVIRWDGDEPLAVGDAVKMVAEDGTEGSVEDGTYVTESHSIEVADGKVKGIADAEVKASEEAPAEEPAEAGEEAPVEAAEEEAPAAEETEVSGEAKPDAFAEMMQRMGKSFEDKMHAIYEAFYAAGIDAYVLEAGEEFAVAEIYDNGWKYYRYTLSFMEDGTVTLGDRVEVFPAYVTAEEKAESESKYAAQQAELARVQAELEKVKAQPAAQSAHEQFKAFEGVAPITGDQARDNVSRILSAK